MFFETALPHQRFFVPEVIQTSAMDCGPAALKSILEGFDIGVSYGRLREACQTDIDGTSIDTIEEVAQQLGLQAEQVMIPADHLLLPESESLPAIVVVRQPNGLTHFIVVWSMHGPLVQIMDPGMGRQWLTKQQLTDILYHHSHPVPAEMWRAWAESPGFYEPLTHRMYRLGLNQPEITPLLEQAQQDESWYTFAALDATTRMVSALIQADGLSKGPEANTMLHQIFKRAQKQATEDAPQPIPSPYWSVEALPTEEEPMLLMHGVVLVQVLGRLPSPPTETPPISPELLAALEEPARQPEAEILHFLRADGLLVPTVITLALSLSAVGVIIEALLLRSLLDISYNLELVGQRVSVMAAILTFIGGLFLLEIPLTALILKIGRRLELRLRIAFLEKIPRLHDQYFRSRLTSDMSQRAHDLRQLRALPQLGFKFLRLTFQILFTAIGVIWLDPMSAPLAILATAFAFGMSIITQPVLLERDLRLRTHVGALSRFYLDALLGLIPLRTHSADKAVRREHEGLLVEWLRAGYHFHRAETLIHLFEAGLGTMFAVFILFHYVSRGGEASGLLLLFYWSLNLPVLGQALADVTQQYPLHRNRLLRLLEPLDAPEETDPLQYSPPTKPPPPTTGVPITIKNLTVQAGGQTILHNINLQIKPSEHVAVVGPSGAGKSSLVGLLLGWFRPAMGKIEVAGQPLRGTHLEQIRQQTAWVDPAVQLWNRSFFANLQYGNQKTDHAMSEVIDRAQLFSLLERLPQGLQTPLGESGGLVSGGEGQRVRLGRAMLRPQVRLVILDEPFRGLDRTQRQKLLREARAYWQHATLICITHDVGETQDFARVVVLQNGQIVEDGPPSTLKANANSPYGAMLKAEQAVRQGLWHHEKWRRLWLEKGQLSERNNNIKHEIGDFTDETNEKSDPQTETPVQD